MSSSLRILVADNDDTLDLAARVLNALGHYVNVKQTGIEAFQESVTEQYDLLLLKSRLPIMDGLAALSMIRFAERATGRRPLPTVVVMPNETSEEKLACMAAGADACATADHMEGLLYTIDRVLRVRAAY